MSEHLKKGQKKIYFLYFFANSKFNVISSAISHVHFFLNISYSFSSLNLCHECHFYDCHKSELKYDLSEKFNFPWNQLDTIFLVFLHSHNAKPKRNHQIASTRHWCLRHFWNWANYSVNLISTKVRYFYWQKTNLKLTK